MKNIITIASLAGAACAAPTISRPDAGKASSSLADRQTSTFPSTSGTSFVIDGKQQYFAGTNTYWIGFQTNNADVDLVMNMNTPEFGADQYTSMTLERTVVDRVPHAPAFVQMFCSSEVTPSALAPGLSPTIVFGSLTAGTVIAKRANAAVAASATA